MNKINSSKLLKLISSISVFVSSWVVAADLRSRASSELQLKPATTSRSSTKQKARNASANSAVEEAVNSPASRPYIQTVLPPDERLLTRPRWTLELGVENQRPRGQIQILNMNPLVLGDFATQAAYSATLGWWFSDSFASVWGPHLRSSLAAQFAWSQHKYSLTLGQSPQPTPARLQVLRPQLGLVTEYLLGASSKANTEFWFGFELAMGRLIQSQTSQQSDLVNTSLHKSYWEWGSQLRSVISENYIINLQYRQRIYALKEGSSHHGVLAFGLAL